MSESSDSTNSIGERLQGLFDAANVELEPSATLWPRIVAARKLLLRRRRGRIRSAITLAFAASIAVLVSSQHPRVAETVGDDLNNWQVVAQGLERQLQLLDNDEGHHSTGLSDSSAPELAGLDALDRSLQAAYDRNAGSDELEQLWQRRCALLNTLVAVRKQPLLITRI